MRSRLWLGLVAVLLLPLAASLASAEEVVETWRSPAGLYPSDVAASPASNSCWVTYYDPGSDTSSVAQLAADGTLLLQTDAYSWPLAVNTADGSAWLQDPAEGELVHLAADGTELLRLVPPVPASGLAASSADGSCWITHSDMIPHDDGWTLLGWLGHIAEDGTVLLRIADTIPRGNPVVNPTDGSVWLWTPPGVAHLAEDGTQLFRWHDTQGRAVHPSVNPADGSCWVGGFGLVAHLAADGSELWRSEEYGGTIEEGLACAVAVNTLDGSCWVTDRTDVVHLAPNGTELSRTPGFNFTYTPSLSVNPIDGSCWVADVGNNQVARLAVVGYPVQHFTDVSADFWAFAEIEACAAAAIVQGFPDGSYRPDLEVTRDQMAVYIARAMVTASGPVGVQVPSGPAEPTFRDVDVDHWAYNDIEFCAAEGVVQGYPGGNYQPDEPVNRGQMAVYIARSITIPTDAPDPDDFVPAPGSTFPDVTAGNDWAWCFQYVEYICYLPEPIVLGFPDGNYHPEAPVTRDQMAVYIQRGFGLPM